MPNSILPPGFQPEAFRALRSEITIRSSQGNARRPQKKPKQSQVNYVRYASHREFSGSGWPPITGTDGRSDERLATRPLLEREQEPLAVHPAAVASQAAVGADHPMAGDHDRDRVPAVCQADCAGGRRLADPSGQIAVGDGLAVRDRLQRRPHATLELRAVEGERQVEAGQLTAEIA